MTVNGGFDLRSAFAPLDDIRILKENTEVGKGGLVVPPEPRAGKETIMAKVVFLADMNL